jgi:YggT family protein
LYALLQIVALITQIIVVLVIVQFVIGLLFSFNVINSGNQFLFQVYRSINALLEPVLAPIRRVMPDTGAIDFSPLVLILLLQILMIVLSSIPA